MLLVGLYILIIIELLKLKILGINSKKEKYFLIIIVGIVYVINELLFDFTQNL